MNARLVKAHRFIAIGLGIFLIAHFVVHLSALTGKEMHLWLLSSVQVIYRNPLVELLLIASILLQISIGAKLVWQRIKQSHKGFWGWAQIISGIYLAGFLLIHTSAALITQKIIGLETNFYWAAGTLTTSPLRYFFAPYYFLGVMSVFVHLAAALHFGWTAQPARFSTILISIGVAIALLIIATFSGMFYEITLPPEYKEYFSGYLNW